MSSSQDSHSPDEIEKTRSQHTNKEGILHQSELGPKAHRKHFFSPLDPAYADAVNRDAESVEYTQDEERAVRKKIDNIVLPLVVCSGNAHVIDAFNSNFGITNNNKWTLVLSIFYVGYCLLEMPANVLQRHIGANRFFFLSLTFWGLSSLSVVYAKGYAGILVLRVLMGIGEAGYYAGIIYYLSFWYKRYAIIFSSRLMVVIERFWERTELALRIRFVLLSLVWPLINIQSSLCMTGTLPGAIGGLLAFGLVRAHTSLLTGWQFLFLVEAIPTMIMAVMILFFLPSFPFSASFLSPRERAIAQARLNRDHKPQSHGGMNGWVGFKAIISDINAWLFMLIYASCESFHLLADRSIFYSCGQSTLELLRSPTFYQQQLIKNLGFSSINAQGMTVAPYVIGWFMVFLQALHSDRTRDRGYHIMASCAVSFIGYVILATSVQKSVGAAYFALFLVVGGNFSLFPLVMSWAANAFSPTSKRGVGTAFIVSISNTVSM
ncbi:hypothetical protein CVT25_010378 [Psilocybe cyanescens]|uniref:Major facilitator superfamily (MFS) profile domain-containing protein n=1 Tax=Psilocybe cyanescens TaxID=93625 RepID=A0A409XP14_PSICY|nr:hypothetical protein CVT25_010378 [Psilocybe cyanescens]